MNNEEICNLRNITAHNLHRPHNTSYRYESGIRTGISKIRYPICIRDSLKDKRYKLYDYSEESTTILNKPSYLTYLDVAYSYDAASIKAKRYYIEELTFEQAQQIINNNINLFAKVNERVQQDLILQDLMRH